MRLLSCLANVHWQLIDQDTQLGDVFSDMFGQIINCFIQHFYKLMHKALERQIMHICMFDVV